MLTKPVRSYLLIVLLLAAALAGLWLSARRGERRSAAPATPGAPLKVVAAAPRPSGRWQFDCGVRTESAPLAIGSQLLLGTDDGRLLALSLETGRLLWEYKSDTSFGAPPAAAAGRAFIGGQDGMLRALDLQTGSQLWSFATEAEIHGAPALARDKVFIGSYDHNLYCLDAATGKELWRAASDAQLHAGPCVFGDKVAVAGCDGFLRIFSTAEGTALAALELGNSFAAPPVWDGKLLYLAGMDGRMFAVDPARPATPAWEKSLAPNPAGFMAPPAVAGGRAVFVSRGRLAVCLDTAAGGEAWRFTGPAPLDAVPVAFDGVAIFGSTAGRLQALNINNGKLLWEFELGGTVTAPVATAGALVVAVSQDGGVWCFSVK